MGIINRTLDTSEQLEKVQLYQTNTVTATTYQIYRCPRAMQISTARSYCFGLSGAPTGTLKLTRFVVGSWSNHYLYQWRVDSHCVRYFWRSAHEAACFWKFLLNLKLGRIAYVTEQHTVDWLVVECLKVCYSNWGRTSKLAFIVVIHSGTEGFRSK